MMEECLLIGCVRRLSMGKIYLTGIVQGKCCTVSDVVPTPRHKESAIKPQYSQILGRLRSRKAAGLCVQAGKEPALS